MATGRTLQVPKDISCGANHQHLARYLPSLQYYLLVGSESDINVLLSYISDMTEEYGRDKKTCECGLPYHNGDCLMLGMYLDAMEQEHGREKRDKALERAMRI